MASPAVAQAILLIPIGHKTPMPCVGCVALTDCRYAHSMVHARRASGRDPAQGPPARAINAREAECSLVVYGGVLCKTCFLVTLQTLSHCSILSGQWIFICLSKPKELMPQLAKLKAVYIRAKLPDTGASHMHLSGVKIKSSISREKICMSLATVVYSLLQLRFATRTELAQKITPAILFPSGYSKNKNKTPWNGPRGGLLHRGWIQP